MQSDVVIVGGGPAGSASAMYLLRQGIKPLIVEAEGFPRFHIGESMTGECGALLRELGLGEQMLKYCHPTKQGVNVYGPRGNDPWFVPVAGRDAEGKLFDQFAWQVRRSGFDKMMLDEAVARGAVLMRGKATKPLRGEDGSVCGVEVRRSDGGVESIGSKVLLDCSGQASWLANAGVTGPKYLGNYDKQIAIFSHLKGAIRDDGEPRNKHKDNTLIFYQKKYHWAWFIPIDDEVVSIGVVVPSAYFLDKKETKEAFLVRELRELNPELSRRIPEIELIEDVHVIPNYSFQVRQFTGKGFMCIGDSHRFVDPIFSFGLYVAVKESEMAAPVIKAYLDGATKGDASDPFAEHQLRCEKAIDVLEDTIDLFWEQPFAFSIFVHDRYRGDITDVFAGRIYDKQPSQGVSTFRKMLQRDVLRESSYGDPGLYSVPIGSRYHPERAPLWQATSEVETTEAWMGRRSTLPAGER